MTADEVIAMLGLERLPGEGGWFRETYRAPADPRLVGDRCAATHIYFLLRAGEASAMHRVRSDEVFHHFLGPAVEQLRLGPAGERELVRIGRDLAAGERPQVTAARGWWQGARLADDADGYALLGCTVSPGFEWDDFELATPADLAAMKAAHPGDAALIEALTPAGAQPPG